MKQVKENKATHTGKYFKESSTDEVYRLVYVKSSINLCDIQNSSCGGNTYYTDDEWHITYWCQHHFNEQISNGNFKMVKG